MDKNPRDLGYTDEEMAVLSAALEKTGTMAFAPCGTTAHAMAEYGALRLSDVEAAAIRASTARQ